MMTSAIVLREHGGADQLNLEPVTLDPPAKGMLRIRHTAIGVNFHDIYVRTGLYKTLPLPGIPGIEAAGVVEAIGPDVQGFHIGDRIGYITFTYGAYATHRNLPAAIAIRLPDSLNDQLAATILLKGLTVDMLLHRVHQIEAGQSILVHAAAGGVGRLLVQWAKACGATVFGTAGTAEKIQIARAAGCDEVIAYRDQDFAEAILGFTQGKGVDVVYDSVGRDTFDGSLRVLAKLGKLVNFGQSSGAVAPFEISRLAAGSFSIARPIVFHYMDSPLHRQDMINNVFDAWQKGWIKSEAGYTYPLAKAGEAHKALESRSEKAPFILIP